MVKIRLDSIVQGSIFWRGLTKRYAYILSKAEADVIPTSAAPLHKKFSAWIETPKSPAEPMARKFFLKIFFRTFFRWLSLVLIQTIVELPEPDIPEVDERIQVNPLEFAHFGNLNQDILWFYHGVGKNGFAKALLFWYKMMGMDFR